MQKLAAVRGWVLTAFVPNAPGAKEGHRLWCAGDALTLAEAQACIESAYIEMVDHRGALPGETFGYVLKATPSQELVERFARLAEAGETIVLQPEIAAIALTPDQMPGD